MPQFSPRVIPPRLPSGPGGVEQALDHQLQRLLPTRHWLCRAPSLKRKVQWLRRLLDESSHALLLEMAAPPAHPPCPDQPWALRLPPTRPMGTLADFAVTSWLLDGAAPPPSDVTDTKCTDAFKRNQRNAQFHRRQAFELLLVMSRQPRSDARYQVQAALDRQWPQLLGRLAAWPAQARETFMQRTVEQVQFLGCRAGNATTPGGRHG